MFTRLRHLKLSLAAKCQLLFGAAVILIISAALFVPWQRMDQLMKQTNERVAGALADAAINEHVVRKEGDLTPHPATSQAATARATTGPATAPAAATTGIVIEGKVFIAPRLLGIEHVNSEKINGFEKRSIRTFLDSPDQRVAGRLYPARDNGEIYRYARALYAEESTCLKCHSDQTSSVVTLVASAAASRASTQPAQLLGIVSVEIASQRDTSQLVLNNVLLLAAGMLAGVLAIIVFYLITTRLILQPVRVLQETAQKVSEGDLNIRSDISTGDEFQQLSETFNTMLANLKAGEDQLRAINKSLDLKLGQLAESNVALYESNRLKSEFLANVSHELRTPLNSILGFAELLRDSTPAPADGKTVRYLQNILSSGRNLLELINDLLDLAKIEAGRMEVRSEPLSLNDLFEGLTGILKPLLEAKNLTILVTIGGDVPIMHTDPAKLQQILYNFLSNAIKFSPAGGRVDLMAEREGEGEVRISVLDRGPGIAVEKQNLIFDKFRQIDGSVTREHSGTGLGLAISKELIALLSGTIGVKSAAGEGATFWVLLPLRITAGVQDVRARMTLV